jgi:Zn-dependent protease with chaperone function
MIDTMSDEELFFIMGHELGHIKANHVLYFSIGWLLFPLLDILGRRTMGATDVATYALVLALYEWSRQAEFSADRAGLLVAQDKGIAIQSLIRLAAGPSRLHHELNQEAFMDQARAYQDADSLDKLGKFVLFATMGKTMTHPMPVFRTQELEKWVLSGEFDRILSGDYSRKSA